MRPPRIVLIGGTYRALCVLERLIERGDRVVAFVGQEGGGERDFCSEILELCDRASIPARSGRKFGEELVRWLEDRIRPDLAICVGVSTEVPLAIGGNCRLGLIEAIDPFQSESCSGVVLRQRGQDLVTRPLPKPESEGREEDPEDRHERYLHATDELVDALESYLDRLGREVRVEQSLVPFRRPPRTEVEELCTEGGPGVETDALERECRAYLETDHALALRSATAGFELVLEALELGEGDEVIVPGLVSHALLESIEKSGARAVFADVDDGRLTLDPASASELISARTRALVIAHPFGQPADLDALYALADERELEVFEDAGGSFGARYGESPDDSRLGRGGSTAVFRLPVVPGQAAGLLTLSDGLAERVDAILQKDGGLRLSDAMAVAARERVSGWEDELTARRRSAAFYSTELFRYDAFRVPVTPADALPVYAAYVLRLTRFARTSAEDLYKLLCESGIDCRRISVPLAERELIQLPNAEAARSRSILLPMFAGLDESAQTRVLDAIFDYAIG